MDTDNHIQNNLCDFIEIVSKNLQEEIMKKLNWKKIVAGTLSAVMLLSVTACGSSNKKSESAITEAGKKDLTKITFCLDWTPNTNHT